MTRPTLRRVLPVLAATAVLGLAGCSVSGGGGPAADVHAGAATLASLRKAASSTAAVKTQKVDVAIVAREGSESFSFTSTGEFDHVNQRGRTTADISDILSEGEPSDEQIPPADSEMEVVFDGTTNYVRSTLVGRLDPDGRSWLKYEDDALEPSTAPGVDLASDPAGFLWFFEGATGDVTNLGTAELRGVAATHLRSTLDLDKVLAKAEGADRREREARVAQFEEYGVDLGAVPVEVWIDDDGYLRKFVMSFDFASEEDVELTMTVELYDFDEPVDIDIPPASEISSIDPSKLGLGD